jgi:1,4-dihydroxy-2-naphthoate octaprenyltransferase
MRINNSRWLSLLSPLLLLAVWEILARAGAIDTRFFPAPSETFARMATLLQNGTLLNETLITLRRVAIGFVLAAIPAVLLGVLMGVNRFVRVLFQPLIAAMYPIPKIALVPMVVLLFGIGETAKHVVVFISVFFLVALNTAAGVLNLDTRYFDIARNNGARGWDLLWTVALPGALPSILTGINLGLGFALTVIVGTEMLQPSRGLGSLIWQSYQVYDISTIFVALIVVAILGWAVNAGMEEVERQLVPWKPRPSAARALSDATTSEPRIRRFIRIWWMALRPFSFTASITPVAFGTALALYEGIFEPWYAALAIIGGMAIHGGTNLINDYYDWKKGTDTPESLGPNRPLKEGLITINQIFIAAVLCFALGSGIGLYLTATRGVAILIIGVLSVLAGWFYTAGPFAFAYVGLGEIVVFIFMGPIMVLGGYYVQAQSLPLSVLLASAPLGMLVAAILHANNMRDFDADRAKGKRTLANLLGRATSKREFELLTVGAFVVLMALVVLRLLPWLSLLALIELPNVLRLNRLAHSTEDPKALNALVRGSAASHKRFGAWLIVGVLLAALMRV